MSDFVAQLLKLSEHCRFGDQLEEMLCDRLVCGCRDKHLQQTLLAQQEFAFDKAFKMARAMEISEQEVRDLQQNTPQSVHAVHSSDKKSNHQAIVVVGSICPQPASSRLLFAATVISKAISPPFAGPRFEMPRRKRHQLNPHISFKQRTRLKSLSMQCFIHLHLALSPSWLRSH